MSNAMTWSGWERDYDVEFGGVVWRKSCGVCRERGFSRKYLFRIISIGNID